MGSFGFAAQVTEKKCPQSLCLTVLAAPVVCPPQVHPQHQCWVLLSGAHPESASVLLAIGTPTAHNTHYGQCNFLLILLLTLRGWLGLMGNDN